jgi:ribosomal protein S12 methylthiotransferase accessory factor
VTTTCLSAPPTPAVQLPPATDPLDGLDDPLSGLIARLWRTTPPVWAPPGLRLWLAQLARTDPIGSPLGSDTTTGCAWWDCGPARAAALGEAVEWYAGSLVPAELPVATAAELRRRGEPHVAPETLTLYSPEQYAAEGFPFRPFTDELPVRWCAGRDLVRGERRWVPASLVYLGYGTGPTRHEPFTNLPVSAGIAAAPGPSGAGLAAAAALREVVERDALAAAWTHGSPLDPLVLPSHLATDLGADDATVWSFHRLPTVIDAPGVLATVRHRPTGIVGVGAAVRDDPETAARKAISEAVVSAASAIELDTEGSDSAARHVAAGTLRPWRADRSYTSSYRDDRRDVLDIACHLQLYLDPRLQRALDDRLDALAAGRPPLPLDALATVAPGSWAGALSAAGLEPVAVDVTPSDVARRGWHVVRTVVPGLRSTGPAAFPFLGSAPTTRPGHGAPHLDPVPHA